MQVLFKFIRMGELAQLWNAFLPCTRPWGQYPVLPKNQFIVD